MKTRFQYFAQGCLLTGTLLVLSACEATQEINSAASPQLAANTVVLLPPPNVELYEYHLSGELEPRADWSELGEQNVMAALRMEEARRGFVLVPLDYSDLSDHERGELAQIEKLHEAVAWSMMLHRHVPALRLPTKTSVYDWSLGPEVARLRRAGGEQGKFALFITLEDSFSSGGRRAMQILAAIGGAHVPGGAQVGYASLVDLDSGRVAWFGSLARSMGDLRKPDGAADAIGDLLAGLTQ